MKSLTAVLVTLSILTISGCFYGSLHPLGDAITIHKNDYVLGTWMPYDRTFDAYNPDVRWVISKDKNEQYDLVIDDGKTSRNFDLQIVRLGEQWYFDISKSIAKDDTHDIIPVHQIIRIRKGKFGIIIQAGVSQDEFRQVAQKAGVPFTKINDQLVVTASTKELQKFYQTHADELFTDRTAEIVKRKQSE